MYIVITDTRITAESNISLKPEVNTGLNRFKAWHLLWNFLDPYITLLNPSNTRKLIEDFQCL